MDVMAKGRFVRMSPSKGRDFARRLQGLPAAQALDVAHASERKAARLLAKVLKSAVANAKNNAHLATDDLVVKVAVIEDGPRMKRFWPRARGGVSPVKRRLSHIRIVLSDGRETEKV